MLASKKTELLFGTHTFNFNCIFDDFKCVFTQIHCLSRLLGQNCGGQVAFVFRLPA